MAKRDKLRVMVDANMLFRGMLHPRFAFEILNHAFKKDFELILLSLTIEEAVRNISAKFPAYLTHLETFLIKCPYQLLENPSIQELEKEKGLIRDESDLPLAVAAIKAKVDYLITNDADFVGEGKTTSKVQGKITCITAGNFLKKVMGWTSEELSRIQDRKWEKMR